MLELVCMRVSMKIVSNVRKYVLVRAFVNTIRVAAMQYIQSEHKTILIFRKEWRTPISSARITKTHWGLFSILYFIYHQPISERHRQKFTRGGGRSTDIEQNKQTNATLMKPFSPLIHFVDI